MGKSVSKPIMTVAEQTAAISQIQHADAATKSPNDPPMTGVQVAAELARQLPPPPPAGTRYSVRELGNPDAPASTVTSPDGSIEDAVRTFNAGRKSILTAKQLILERLDKPEAA